MTSNADFGTLPNTANGVSTRFTVEMSQVALDNLKDLPELSPIGKMAYENTLPNIHLGTRHEWVTNAVKS